MMKLFVPVVALVACTGAAAQTVTIGVEDDWAPYSSIMNGQTRGFAADLVRESFAAVDVEVKFVALPYVRCMAMAKLGTLAGCLGAVPNRLIADYYLWSTVPLFKARMKVYALARSGERGLTAGSLEGKTVGVTRGYQYGDEFDLNAKVRREVSNRNDQGFRKLLAGRMQYMAAEEKSAKMVFARYPAEFGGKFRDVGMVATPGLYLAFTQKSPDGANYLEKFNSGYAIIIKRGRYKALETAWFGSLAALR